MVGSRRNQRACQQRDAARARARRVFVSVDYACAAVRVRSCCAAAERAVCRGPEIRAAAHACAHRPRGRG